MHRIRKSVTMLFPAAIAISMLCRMAVPQEKIATSSQDEEALVSATRELCDARVAMIGEIATHGDGHTLAFKVALVERLIDRCGFNAVFFEANQDEFLHLSRQLRLGQRIASQDILTAVGGIWKFYKEFQPLSYFLLQRVSAGQLTLAGLDDRLGQLGQNYANETMITELAHLLPFSRQQACITAFHKRIYQADAQYSKLEKEQLQSCLAAEQSAAISDRKRRPDERAERLEMLSATERWISRDLTTEGAEIADRDRSMFQTFQWQQRRLPKRHKIIVWAATVHITKQGDPVWGDKTGTNLGGFLHREFGQHAKALGFSAISGSFRQGKGNYPCIPSPPPGSIEAMTFHAADADAAYISSTRLRALGTRPGAFFYHSYQTLPWSNFLDGAVIFRAEQPPTDVR